MSQKILLITWWTWYIGSHVIVAFEQAGYRTVNIDNLSNSTLDSIDGMENILSYRPIFHQGDICDDEFLDSIFSQYGFDGVIHLAWLKSVSESCMNPWIYHKNNIWGSMTLFWKMNEYGVHNIVFSSSATVYSPENQMPLTENSSLWTTNPYGTTKLVIEKLLEDYSNNSNWSTISLRYFNPIGAHPSWYIGESPTGVPNNLLPYIMDVAIGKRDMVRVFWDDYPTLDGTGIRDYIDICDLVDAHIRAYEHLAVGYMPINIWTGKWTSVLELIDIVRWVTGREILYEIAPKRAGDIACCYAAVDRADQILNWKAKYSIADSIQNSWNYVNTKNPKK